MPDLGLLRGGARAKLAGDTRFSKRARTHMANNPKKVKDPTEVALSAIQEALNISDPNADSGRSAQHDDHHDDVAPPVPPAMPSFESVFETREPRQPRMDQPRAETPAFEPIEETRAPVATRRPANDDRE